MSSPYTQFYAKPPTADEIAALPGAAMLEFGTGWCGICLAAQAAIADALEAHPGVRHLKVADARGQPLGRAFRVKLWPTLVFLRDGREVARLVRPQRPAEIERELAALEAAAPAPPP